MIPESVTKIGNGAFYDCGALKSIEITNKVTEIGECAFYGCNNLKFVEIPKSVIYIGRCAFERCKKISEVYCRIEHLNSVVIDDDAFKDTDISSILLYVPIGTRYEYKHHPIFGKFKEIITER